MFSVSFDPLEQVASLAVLHNDEQLPSLLDADCVVNLHHMLVVNCSLNLDLHVRESLECIFFTTIPKPRGNPTPTYIV